MGIYIVGAEGYWPDHNNLRAPVLINSENYPNGYPRSDYHEMRIIHDGGDFFIVFLSGSKEFEDSYFNAEILCAGSLDELLNTCKTAKLTKTHKQYAKKAIKVLEIGDFNKKFRFERVI